MVGSSGGDSAMPAKTPEDAPGAEGLRVSDDQYARYRHGAGAVAGLACLAILLAGVVGADIGTDVTLISDGSTITLSEVEQSQIAVHAARPAPPAGQAESQLHGLRSDRRPAGERVEPGG